MCQDRVTTSLTVTATAAAAAALVQVQSSFCGVQHRPTAVQLAQLPVTVHRITVDDL